MHYTLPPNEIEKSNKRLDLYNKITSHLLFNPDNPNIYRDALSVLQRIPSDAYDNANGNLIIEPAKQLIAMAEEATRNTDSLLLKSELYDIRRDAYTAIAPFDLDSFMIAMEWNRDPKARFWLPRRKALEGRHHIASQLQDFMYDDSKFLSFSQAPGTGKLLADDTPVLTRNGWKCHGDLVVGDEVIGLDGQFKRVEHVFPKSYANRRVTFANGEVIYCHANHEWLMHSRHTSKPEPRVYETKQMENDICTGTSGKRGSKFNYLLPLREPITGEHKDLPVPPYTLGAWIGDGTTTDPNITSDPRDLAVIDRITEDGYEISSQWSHKTTGCITTSFKGLRADLQRIGLCHSRRSVDKYIPEEYLTASLEQRLELLAGLIDADGTKAESHKYRYSTTNSGVAESVKTLLSTFGWRVTEIVTPARTSSSGIHGKLDTITLQFCPTIDIPCVLPRKQHDTIGAKQRRIALTSIKPCNPIQGNCIQVEGGVYLVGRTMIPTHNSTIIKFLMAYIAGKEPFSMNMYVSYGTSMINMMLNAVYDMIMSPEYRFREIFPMVNDPDVSREYGTISYRRKGDFATLAYISLSGSVTGRTRANRFMIVDDLVKNDEEARSPERLNKLWLDYTSTLTTRTIGEKVKILMLGTMWSLHDPINRMLREHEGDPAYKFIAIPVWDEQTEKSNYDYDCEDAYTTESIRVVRSNLEPYAFSALYLCRPMEKEGLAFKRDEMIRFNGVLPDCEPDRKVFVIDVAWGGGDSLSMPIAYVYGEEAYIVDWLFDRSDKSITQPRVVGKIISHGLRTGTVEANNGGDGYKDDISSMLKSKNYRCNIKSKKAPGTMAKLEKIEQHAPTIRQFIFLDDDKQSDEYRAAFNEFTSFSFVAKNLHDDAADSLAQLSDHLSNGVKSVTIARRVF